MTSLDDICPACGLADSAIYEAEGELIRILFRIRCANCGHSTEQYTDLELARLEWLGSRGDNGLTA